MKKGQVSVFVITAIVVILVIISIFYFNSKELKISNDVFSKLGIASQANTVQESIRDCLKQSSVESITIIGLQGGYYKTPKKSFDLGWSFISYYYYEGDLFIPTKETIEKELADYINNDIKDCINNLKFKNFEISYRNSDTHVEIKNKKVEFVINGNLILTKAGVSADYELKNFLIIIDSQLKDMIEISNEIGKQLTTEPHMICSSCLVKFAEEKNVYIDMMDFADETHSLFVISTDQATFPVLFRFLNKYTQEEVDEYLEKLGNLESPKEPKEA